MTREIRVFSTIRPFLDTRRESIFNDLVAKIKSEFPDTDPVLHRDSKNKPFSLCLDKGSLTGRVYYEPSDWDPDAELRMEARLLFNQIDDKKYENFRRYIKRKVGGLLGRYS